MAEQYDCQNCKYLARPENFCGCCMMKILDEFYGKKKGEDVDGNSKRSHKSER